MDFETQITSPLQFKQHPVYLEDALAYFFNNAQINLYDGDIAINLMDFFPVLKQRYTFRFMLTTMIYIYASTNNLQDPTDSNFLIPDELFNTAFGGTIPAYFYNYRDPVTGRPVKITMEEAVNSGLINNYLNTYQSIQSYQAAFNSQRFQTFYIQNINALNYTKVTEERLGSDVINAITQEFTLANEIYKILLQSAEPYRMLARAQRKSGLPINVERTSKTDVYDFIRMALSMGLQNIVNRLINHPNVNRLNTSIIFQDLDTIRANLLLIDPRVNNNRSYFLASETQNPVIIQMVKDNIIQRNMLHKRVLAEQLALADPNANIPQTNLPETFYKYTQTLM